MLFRSCIQVKDPHQTAGKKFICETPDDIVCQICADGEYEDKNMIVLCSSCNLSVHQKCYGIFQVPSEDWICDVCKSFGLNKGKLLRCLLCSVRGGAMKPTTISSRDPFFSKQKYSVRSGSKDEKDSENEPNPAVLWIHLSCAHWIPELELWSKDINRTIPDLNLSNKKRFKLTCNICKKRGCGCCIHCNKGKCQK